MGDVFPKLLELVRVRCGLVVVDVGVERRLQERKNVGCPFFFVQFKEQGTERLHAACHEVRHRSAAQKTRASTYGDEWECMR